MSEAENRKPRKVVLPASFLDGSPPYEGELPRITVLIGANGSGKTKLLRALRQYFIDADGVLRTMTFRSLNSITHLYIGAAQPLRSVTNGYQTQRSSRDNLDAYGRSHFDQALHVLNADDNIRISKFVEASAAHENDPENVARPKIPVRKVEEVFALFESIFGLKLTHDIEGEGKVSVTEPTGETQYEPKGLSGGESWALSVLPDFVLFKDEHLTIFVDEPESYFNEGLAISFWSQIEAARPNWRFVYATHNVEFASRPGIEKILLLRSRSLAPIELNRASEISIEDHKRILGYAPRLVRSERTLFVEGEKGSIDELFYPAIIDDASVLISPLKGCLEVIAAVKGEKVWEKVVREGVVVRG